MPAFTAITATSLPRSRTSPTTTSTTSPHRLSSSKAIGRSSAIPALIRRTRPCSVLVSIHSSVISASITTTSRLCGPPTQRPRPATLSTTKCCCSSTRNSTACTSTSLSRNQTSERLTIRSSTTLCHRWSCCWATGPSMPMRTSSRPTWDRPVQASTPPPMTKTSPTTTCRRCVPPCPRPWLQATPSWDSAPVRAR
jgi:hypothetical protein